LDAGALAGKAFEQFFVEIGEGASRGGRDFQDSNDMGAIVRIEDGNDEDGANPEAARHSGVDAGIEPVSTESCG